MNRLLALLALALFATSCSKGTQLPENCEIRVEGECFQEASAACAAAGCADECTILDSYPGQVECGQPADGDGSALPDARSDGGGTKGAVLFVVSGHTELGDTGMKTGYFLSEVAHPWHVITTAGFTVDFVSPAGGKVEMDPKSRDLDDPINARFLETADGLKLNATLKPSDVDASTYRAIYYAGGHGAMWDFPGSTDLATLASKIWEANGVVAAVCHGPAGLVDIKLSDGSYLVAGKKVAAFTNSEEAAVELTGTVPFLLATRLEERGATHVPAADFQAHVVVDGRLVTGQNPASATGAGEAIVRLLAAQD